jgi:hypothetical protein
MLRGNHLHAIAVLLAELSRLPETMPLSIGELVHHSALNVEARVVRIVKLHKGIGYVVRTKRKASGEDREALWWPQEIRELKEEERKYRAQSS